MKRQVGVVTCAALLAMGAMVSCGDSDGGSEGNQGTTAEVTTVEDTAVDTTAVDTTAVDTTAVEDTAGEGDTTGDLLTRDELIAELMQEGMPVETATCVADALDDAGIEVHTVMPPAEVQKAAELATECMIQDVGSSPEAAGS